MSLLSSVSPSDPDIVILRSISSHQLRTSMVKGSFTLQETYSPIDLYHISWIPVQGHLFQAKLFQSSLFQSNLFQSSLFQANPFQSKLFPAILFQIKLTKPNTFQTILPDAILPIQPLQVMLFKVNLPTPTSTMVLCKS